MKAIDSSKELFNNHFLPRLKERYPECIGNFAAGLIGHGSECFGFDDEISLDHDVSNGFYIWLDEDNDIKYSVKLFRVYKEIFEEFGKEYGIKSGAVKRGVITISDFMENTIGSKELPKSISEWLNIPTYALANATNGEIFYDGNGIFTKAVDYLKNEMPLDVKHKKLSASLALAAQSGQYNFMRTVGHGEFGAAAISLTEFVQNISEAAFLLNGKFMPYYKWALKSLENLEILNDIAPKLEFLLCEATNKDTAQNKSSIIEEVSAKVIDQLKRQNLTQSNSDYLEHHAFSVASKIGDEALKNTHIMQK
ncbi:MAG: DUF4037 domain-containing protein [Clostridia bacterium]|nr:DUF4037 domain-containing protein [Clostridia bacterium]